MSASDIFQCRAAACVERLDDGKEWSIFLLNDENFIFDRIQLISFGHSGGGDGSFEETDLEIHDFPAGKWIHVWRDDDFEMRMHMTILIEAYERRQKLMADFPKLYRRKKSLLPFDGIGLPGFVIHLEFTAGRRLLRLTVSLIFLMFLYRKLRFIRTTPCAAVHGSAIHQ